MPFTQGPTEIPGIPDEVVRKTLDGAAPAKAWREYLNLSLDEVSTRLNISPAAYSALESCTTLSISGRETIAAALGITPEQLNF